MKTQAKLLASFLALGAIGNLSLISRHGVLSVCCASPESSVASPSSSLRSTTLADGVEGEVSEVGGDVWQARKEVVEEGEGSNQPEAGTAPMKDTRLRTTTTRGGRQGLSSSSRLGRLLSKSSWRKLSKVMISLTMAVTVASLLLTLRKISSMCTAKLGELKPQSRGGLSNGDEGSRNVPSPGGSAVEEGESVPEICRTLGLAQSHGEEALAHGGKDKTVQGENFFQKLLKTRSLSQQAIAVAVALLLISLACTTHAAERIGFGTWPGKKYGSVARYQGKYVYFDEISWFRERRYCQVIHIELPWWQAMWYSYHREEYYHVVRKVGGVDYHYGFFFSRPLVQEMERLGIPKAHRYWVAEEWASQIGHEEGKRKSGTNVPLMLWYVPQRRSS